MNEEELAALSAPHARGVGHELLWRPGLARPRVICVADDEAWPCGTVRLVAEVRRLKTIEDSLSNCYCGAYKVGPGGFAALGYPEDDED